MRAMSKLALIVKTRTKPGARDQVRDVLYLFEVYRDQGTLQQAAQAPWFAEYMGQAAPLLAGEPQVTMASSVWETGLARQASARRRLR